jgi:hypothetical protein
VARERLDDANGAREAKERAAACMNTPPQSY